MEKKFKKVEIDEIIDGDDNIIGIENEPTTGPDQETKANKTTDYNAKVHGQNFKNDFLGRFGFYFYEGEGSELSPVMKSIAAIVGEENVNAVMGAIKPHLEETIDGSNFYNINESKVLEDKLTPKKEDDNSMSKKTKEKELTSKKIEDVADLLKKLPKSDKTKLINLLEERK